MLKKTLLVTCGLAVGCAERDLATDLNDEGPPMILQVIAKERIDTGNGLVTEDQFAFGEHPDVTDDDGSIVGAVAEAGGAQEIRIVIDELLRGNTLEEIACADGTWERIPPGTTAANLDSCTPPSTVDCTAVCTHPNPNTPVGEDPLPTGIFNEAAEGLPPQHKLRFIDGSVQIVCDGEAQPLNISESFWQPSGNQLRPGSAANHARSLGPAVVLVPELGLKTNSTCTFAFDSSVTDKTPDQLPVCAPDWSAVDPDLSHQDKISALECPGTGDLSLLTFGVEPLRNLFSLPQDGQMNINVTQTITIRFNANIDLASITGGGITITENGGANITYTAAHDMNSQAVVILTPDAPFAANTEYTVSLNTTLADQLGGTFPATETITFTTAP